MPSRSFWRSKPPPGVQIDRSHPLALGIRGFWTLNENAGQIVNAVTGKRGLRVGAITWVGDASGPSLKCATASSSNYVNLGTDPFLQPTSLPITMGICVTPGVYSTFGQLWMGSDASNANYVGCSLTALPTGLISIAFGSNTGTTDVGARRKNGTTAMTVGRRIVVFGVFRGPTDMSIYINGGEDGGTYVGTGGDMAYGTANETRLFDSSGQAFGTLSTIHWAGIWARGFTPDEVRSISSDPYAMFRPPVWVSYPIVVEAPPSGVVAPPVGAFVA